MANKRRRKVNVTQGRRKPVDLERTGIIQLLMFGDPGIGKTEKLGELKNVLIIRPPGDHTESIADTTGIKEFVVKDWEDMDLIHMQLQQGLMDELFPDVDGKDRWVWFDSLSIFQDYGVDDVFKDAVARKESRKEFGADKGEYGINMQRLARHVRNMVGLSESGAFNYGVVCHAAELEDRAKGDVKLRPAVTGKDMWSKIMGCMKTTVFVRVVKQGKGTVRVFETKPTEDWDAANKLGGLGSNGRMVEPTMPALVAALQGGSKAEGKPSRRKRKGGKRRRRNA